MVTCFRSDYQENEQRIAKLELELKLQKEELELTHQQQLGALQQQYEAEQCDVREKHSLQLLSYENLHAQVVLINSVTYESVWCAWWK